MNNKITEYQWEYFQLCDDTEGWSIAMTTPTKHNIIETLNRTEWTILVVDKDGLVAKDRLQYNPLTLQYENPYRSRDEIDAIAKIVHREQNKRALYTQASMN